MNYPTRNRPLVKTTIVVITIVVITCTTKLTVQYWDALSPCPNKGKELHMCVWQGPLAVTLQKTNFLGSTLTRLRPLHVFLQTTLLFSLL